MPGPGAGACVESMSASWFWPFARSPAMTWSLVRPGWELLAEDALEDVVGRVAQDLRTDDGERTLTTASTMTSDDQRPLRAAACRAAAGTSRGSPWAWPAAGPCPCIMPGRGRPADARAARRRRRPAPGRRPGPPGAPAGRVRRRLGLRWPPGPRCCSCRGLRLGQLRVARSRGRSRWTRAARGACRCRRSGPSSMTRIWSAFMIVPTRWATMIRVAPPSSRSRAARRRASVREVQRREAVVEDQDPGAP